MVQTLKARLKGINAINVTPFDDQLSIHWSDLERNIQFLLDQKIDAIYPCGNTGEFYSLTLQEAKEVTRFAVDQASGQSLVIAGVGYDVNTACELAAHAEQSGADGIMVHQPVHPYILSSGLIAYYKQIAASTDLPMILYVRSEQVTPDVFAQISSIANVVAVKYAVNHLPAFSKAVQSVDTDIVWLCGTAEMWAPYYYTAGAEGFTSGLVNVDAGRSFAMLLALRSGNVSEAMRLWKEVLPFEELRAAHANGNNVSVVKEAMYQMGFISSPAVRPPICALQPEEKALVSNILKQWGMQPSR